MAGTPKPTPKRGAEPSGDTRVGGKATQPLQRLRDAHGRREGGLAYQRINPSAHQRISCSAAQLISCYSANQLITCATPTAEERAGCRPVIASPST
eukprot:1913706-Prymnesium_polylepis.2